LSESTWKQYENYIKKWAVFCSKKSWSVWDVNITHYLCFLMQFYEQGLSYMTISSAGSALSLVFICSCKQPIGENRLITRFMRGISRLRPPSAKYSATWDADKVLTVLKTMNNDDLTVKQLPLKLVDLLALVTGQRVQTLAAIKLKDIEWSNPVQIKLTSRLKTTTVSRNNPVLVLPSYIDNNLCPVNALKAYVNLTEGKRGNVNNLFVSFNAPYAGVTSQTVSRWLVYVLKLAGVDLKKIHSS